MSKYELNNGKTGTKFYIWTIFLLILMGIGLIAFIHQWNQGLQVTGMRNIATWGAYIIMFAFFVGLSAGGLIMSSSVKVFNAKDYASISRPAVLTAIACVVMAALVIIPDLGRPDRILNLITSPQLYSPLMWDFIVIASYLILSLIYLWLMTRADFIRKGSVLALGSRDISERAIERDHKVVKVFALIALPLAILLHSVTAWIFGLQMGRVPWHTPLMAPIFIASALDSGLALLIVVLLALDKFGSFKLDKKLLPKMATLLAVFIAVDLFLMFVELLTTYWPSGEAGMVYFDALLSGPFAWSLWYEILIGGLVPLLILAIPRARKSAPAVVIASVLLMTGIIAKRINLIMPGLYYPNMANGPGIPLGTIPPDAGVPFPEHVFAFVGTYTPTMIEIAIVVGILAVGALIITIGSKIVPMNEPTEAIEGEELPEGEEEQEVISLGETASASGE